MRVGVDTGGTFTDCVVSAGSEVRILKVFSTPEDSTAAILGSVRQLIGPGASTGLDLIHGTTVGTNTLLERRGARVALVTTAGFEDLLEIGRQNRPRLYDLDVQRQPPLVPRARRCGVRERTAAGGRILLRPRRAELRRLRGYIKRTRAESIALCFLFSFANPGNERVVARALGDLGLPLSVSHEILPEFREYERLCAVVINAYLASRLGSYLKRLAHDVEGGKLPGPSRPATPRALMAPLASPDARIPAADPVPASDSRSSAWGRVYVMQSSGGITTALRAAREPVRTILSGPAGGVVAAAWLAQRLRMPRAISFDMGGTSTDVSLFEGSPRPTNETTLGGLPLAVPVLDIHSVGAGGGSLARLDAGGALRVGPESAGASPGPAGYGRGGTQPTVTDANLILGRLDPDHFLGGSFPLNLRAAEESFAAFLREARRVKRSAPFKTAVDLARGILAVSNATMERALRVISVERGHDPRDFALICFGGAGALHAADLAGSLGLARVIVPENPGVFSALGVLLSDIVKDVSCSVLLRVPGTGRGAKTSSGESRPPTSVKEFGAFLRGLKDQFERLEQAARAELRHEHPRPMARRPSDSMRIEHRLDLRYAGQAYELSVPFTADFPARFQLEHEKAYGYAHRGRPLEIVTLRVRLVLATPKPPLTPSRLSARSKTSRDAAASLVKHKPVWWEGGFQATPLYDRKRLETGLRLRGPAVVVEYSSTTAVPPGWTCRVDDYRNLILSQDR
jgi:N-methylhydantoinase A